MLFKFNNYNNFFLENLDFISTKVPTGMIYIQRNDFLHSGSQRSHLRWTTLGEVRFSKVATGNWTLEANERWKEIKISGALRAVIVFRPWGFLVTGKRKRKKERKKTKASLSFFYQSLDACCISPYSDWLFYWELLPMLCVVFRKRVLEGSNCKSWWPFIKTQES